VAGSNTPHELKERTEAQFGSLFRYYVCVHSAWKGRPRNDLYCVEWDIKPHSLTFRAKMRNLWLKETQFGEI